MKKYDIRGQYYELISGDDCFHYDEVKEYITDYFDPFDYIFGDFSGGKVRLKGFYDSINKNVKKYNDIQYLNIYIKEYCNFGSKTFLLKKLHKK